MVRIVEQKRIGSLRARVNGRLIGSTFCIGSKVIRYGVKGVLFINFNFNLLISSYFS